MYLTRSRRAGALGLGLAVAGVTTIGVAPAFADPVVDVQILATNDFHGRIQANGAEAGAAVLAGAVQQLRTANPNTVFAAAGDLIGASTFESFIQHDKPTIDALNAAGLEVSAVGNHEFDAGYDDLVNRVMAAYDPVTNPEGGAAWQYIGANVKFRATGDDAIPATWIKDFGDVEVGFVGAVTEELPALVSPAGIADLQVTDIVTTTNEEATALKAEGADVVVLLVHEGAPSTDCATMDDSGTWADVVNGVNADVDAIVSGHTHLAYNCAFPVAAWAAEGRAVTERPVVSAGQYGTNLNRLVFSVDAATGDVVAKSQAVLPLAGAYPADAAVTQLVSDAVAQAEVLGAQTLGEIGGAFNRARLSTGTDYRGGESTLGNLVAEVQQWATETPESGAAQIAFMNPGGLRTDMTGTGTGPFPRTLTYKQAAVVQPFANTLVNMGLTGANIKLALEQQWQRDTAGNVPTRPFLRLGVSEGFSYTFDAARPEGDRITGMWLDGVPIDLAATYSVTVNSFLASGGDNFRAFNAGTGKRDTGKIDLTAMVDYLATFAADQPLPVDYSQRAVGVSFPAGAPASYTPGAHVAFNVSSWTMTTPDDAKDAAVDVALRVPGQADRALGSFPLDNTIGTALFDDYGTAAVDVVLPADTPVGDAELVLTGATTGTTAAVPVEVAKAVPTLTVDAPAMIKHKKGVATLEVAVASPAATPTGTVEAVVGGHVLDSASLSGGSAELEVGPFAKGAVTVVVRYLGDSATEAAQTNVTIRVVPSGR